MLRDIFFAPVFFEGCTESAAAVLNRASHTPAATSRQRFHSRICLALVLAIAFFLSLPSLAYPMHPDQSLFSLIGQQILEGHALYRDMWDLKPPGVFLVYAGIERIFGSRPWAIGIVDIAYTLAASVLIFYFARLYLGSLGASVGVVAFAFWHVHAGYWHAGQAETFLLLFVLLAFLLMPRELSHGRLHSSAALAAASAGACAAAAWWIKYNALFFFPLILLLPYLRFGPAKADSSSLPAVPRREWLRCAAFFAAGFAILSLAVIAYLMLSGAWAAFWETEWRVLPRYGASALQQNPHYLFWALQQTIIVIGLPTILAGILAIALAAVRRDWPRLVPILIACACGYAFCASQLRLMGYSFEACFPFFALFWGYLAVAVWELARQLWLRSRSRRARTVSGMAAMLVLVAVVPTAAAMAKHEATTLRARYSALAGWTRDTEFAFAGYRWPIQPGRFPDVVKTVKYLRAQPNLRAGLFIWGNEPLIYLLTHTRPSTRFVQDLPLLATWGPAPWRAELMADLQRQPPRYIIVERTDQTAVTGVPFDSEGALNTYPQLRTFIADRYTPIWRLEGFILYRGKAAGSAGTPKK